MLKRTRKIFKSGIIWSEILRWMIVKEINLNFEIKNHIQKLKNIQLNNSFMDSEPKF